MYISYWITIPTKSICYKPDLRMMFNWHNEELEPVKQLNTIHTRHTHVQEHTKQHRARYKAQKRSHENRETQHHGHNKGR